MNFEKLVYHIQQANNVLQQRAIKAVNMHLTLRNWLTGFYIVELNKMEATEPSTEQNYLKILLKTLK